MFCGLWINLRSWGDKVLWQTVSTFDLVPSSYKWIQTILACGKHSTTMQTWIVSRLWFCGRPWRLEINLRRCLVYFRKSHVFANKLDVQETDFSFTQFYRSWNHFSRMQVYAWTVFPLSLSGILVIEVFHSVPNRTDRPKREPRKRTRRQFFSQKCISPSRSSTPTSFQQTLITFHSIQRILVLVLYCMS